MKKLLMAAGLSLVLAAGSCVQGLNVSVEAPTPAEALAIVEMYNEAGVEYVSLAPEDRALVATSCLLLFSHVQVNDRSFVEWCPAVETLLEDSVVSGGG